MTSKQNGCHIQEFSLERVFIHSVTLYIAVYIHYENRNDCFIHFFILFQINIYFEVIYDIKIHSSKHIFWGYDLVIYYYGLSFRLLSHILNKCFVIICHRNKFQCTSIINDFKDQLT